ncbi:MAG: metallophosphatase, partial [Clostridia bacterium]|nr:metallophosphatase [Clostridia bacterium]
THDAPSSHRIYLGYPDTDELNRYLESLRDEMEYGKWFYGHLHDNRMVFENNILLYEQIIRVN